MSHEPWLVALKLFFPSWNFFNDFGLVPRLEVLDDDNASEAPWRPLYPVVSTTRLSRMLWNPGGNQELLEKSLIDRAATELAGLSEAGRSTFGTTPWAGRLTRIVRSRLQRASPARSSNQVRFRVVLTAPGQGDEVLFTSTPFPLHHDPA